MSPLKHLFHEIFTAPKIQRLQPYTTIDPLIKPLVDSLSLIEGVTTIASCQGHCAGRIEAPYVYFQAPLAVAEDLIKQCREQRAKFHTSWEIHGLFNEKFQLTYSLHAPVYTANYINQGCWLLGWHRSRVNQDLATLTEIVNVSPFKKFEDEISRQHQEKP